MKIVTRKPVVARGPKVMKDTDIQALFDTICHAANVVASTSDERMQIARTGIEGAVLAFYSAEIIDSPACTLLAPDRLVVSFMMRNEPDPRDFVEIVVGL